MKRIGRTAPLSIVLFGGRMAGAAVAFGTQALIVHAWGAVALGDYLFVLAAANIAAALMPLGFQTVGGYFAAHYSAGGSRRSLLAYIRQGYLQIALLAVVCVALALAAFASGDPLWLPAAAMAVAIAVVQLNGSVLSGLRRPLAGMVAEALLRPMLMLGGFLAATALAPMLWMAAIGYAAVALAQTLVMSATVRRIADGTAAAAPARATWWRYAAPWAVIGLATDFFFDIDLVILAHFLSREDLAVFGISARICALLAFGIGAVYTVTMPDILHAGVKRDEAAFHGRIGHANLTAVVIAVLLSAAMFMSGPLLGLMFGPSFAPAGVPLGIMSFGLVLRATFGPAPLVLSFYDKPWASVPAAVVGLALLLAANVVLVPHFGLTGAAIAATLAMGIWAFMQWRTARRLLAIDVSIYPRLSQIARYAINRALRRRPRILAS